MINQDPDLKDALLTDRPVDRPSNPLQLDLPFSDHLSKGLEWRNLTFQLSKSKSWKAPSASYPSDMTPDVKQEMEGPKTVLKGAFGQAMMGEVLVLVGSSGSGKTSLLNVLAHRFSQYGKYTVTGDVLLDGGPQRSGKGIRRVSSYMEQQESFHKNLTLQEILKFTIDLTSKAPETTKLIRLTALLDELNLHKCANTKVGDFESRGISGGERKRLSLGVELIHRKSILFLDEPTSGLDSFNALLVVSLLKKLAK